MGDVSAKVIWLYWENAAGRARRPPFIDACIESIHRNRGSADIVVLDPSIVDSYVSNLASEWRTISTIAHRADYVRARVLSQHGGLWLDVDAIAVRQLDIVLDLLDSRDLVGWINPQGLVSVGFLASRPGTTAINRWVEAQDEYLHETRFEVLAWNAIGSAMLSRFVRPPDIYSLDQRLIAPISWYEANLLFSRTQSLRHWVSRDTLVIQLYNRETGVRLSSFAYEDLMSSNMLMSRLLRVGTAQSRKSDQWRLTDAAGSFVRMATRVRRFVTAAMH
jgi:hypothetical protein